MRRYILPTLAAVLLVSGYVMATSTDSSKIMPVPPPPPAREDPRYITVTGECSRTSTPDRGLITATATYQHPKSVQEASRYVMDQYQKLNTAVKSMNLSDLTIQTSDYSVNPLFEWVQPHPEKEGKNVLRGYQARLGLSIKTSSIDKLGDIIAKAGEIGIAEVGGFQLMLSEELQNKLHNDCLTEAVANAKNKANNMVTAAGARLGHLMTVSEGYAQPMPMYARHDMMEKKMLAMSAAEAMPVPSIQAGEARTQVNVSATFKID